MKIGLFFGSFNPIHTGHLIIANSICETAGLDEVWFIVSPQNPFKDQKELAPAELRLRWVQKSVEDNPRLKASGIELDLPIPSFTYQTLEFLKSDKNQFHLIMGSDSFLSLPEWKNAKEFMHDYPIQIYRRMNAPVDHLSSFPNANIVNLPILEISATAIRKACQEGNSIKYFVSDHILAEVRNFYSKA